MAETATKQRLLAPDIDEQRDTKPSIIFNIGSDAVNPDLVMVGGKNRDDDRPDFADKEDSLTIDSSIGVSGMSGMSGTGFSGGSGRHHRRNTLHLNKDHDLVINKYPDSRPIPGHRYFTQNTREFHDGIGVVIPFFNEPAHELETTLTSLYKTQLYMRNRSKLWRKKPFCVCIIQDGWFKASDSMKKYLKNIFRKKLDPKEVYNDNGDDYKASYEYDKREPKHWSELYSEFTNYNQQVDGPMTFVIEKHCKNPMSYFSLKKFDFVGDNEMTTVHSFDEVAGNGGGGALSDGSKSDHPPMLHLTLIVKIDNRRKHNSHEWFLGKDGFADAFQCKYLFCTDAYTMFKDITMWELVNYLDKHPRSCGVTGRQRAMNRRQQRLNEVEWKFSIEYILRLTQIYDFELAGSVFNPTYRLIGFLPVLPGPCGLYRSRDVLEDSCREWYFDVVNSEPSQTGLVLGNLRIAEDRVLSYASILKPKRYNLRLGYCPRALFYFEAEVNMDAFIFQRRRWINGTFAGYWYLIISSPQHLWMWNANFFRKIIVFFIIGLNLVQMLALVVSPAFSFVIFKFSLSYLVEQWTTQYDTVTIVVLLFSWFLWFAHVIIHNRNKFNANVIKFLYGLSFLMTVCLFSSLFVIVVIKQENLATELKLKDISETGETILLYLFVFSFVAPFACAFLVDRGNLKGIGLLLKTVVPFFLSFYLMIPWFSSYAFARCWDLTWGNRPAGTELDNHGPKKAAAGPQDERISRGFSDIEAPQLSVQDVVMARFKNMSTVVVVLLLTVNLIVFFIPIYYTAILMGAMLAASAAFMAISLLTLSVDIIWDMISWLFNSICECLCDCCCRWQDQKFVKDFDHLPVKDVRSEYDENEPDSDEQIMDKREII